MTTDNDTTYPISKLCSLPGQTARGAALFGTMAKFKAFAHVGLADAGRKGDYHGDWHQQSHHLELQPENFEYVYRCDEYKLEFAKAKPQSPLKRL